MLLLRDGLVSKEDLESVLGAQHDSRRQRLSGSKLGELLVERGLVGREQVAKLVAEQYELPFIELGEADVDLEVARRLPGDLARNFHALPLSELPGSSLLVAISDPATVLFAEDLREALGTTLRFAVVPPDAMEAAIARVHPGFPGPAPEAGEAEPEEPSDEFFVLVEDVDAEEPANDGRYLGSSRAAAQLWPPLGALLIREGLIDDEELDAALAQQRLSGGKRLGEILVERGTLTRADVARLVAEQYELPFVDLDQHELDPGAAALLPADVARRHSGIPIAFDPDGAVRVAIADPAAVLYSDELRSALDRTVRFAVAAPDAIDTAIAKAYGTPVEEANEPVAESAEEPLEIEPVALELVEPHPAPEPSVGEDEGEGEEEPEPVAEAPVEPVSYDADAPEVDDALERALALGATDVHFTPQPHALVMRVRIEGMLRELASFPSERQAAVLARLKQMAGLELQTAQAPQEGHLRFESGEGADLRLVVLPTARGEKATLHLLSTLSQPASLAELGLAAESEEALRSALSQPSGIVLVCGPPESGCSTTLYALLRELNTPGRALATLESPVEQVLPGVDQVSVDPEAGLTYEAGLRAILLSDPDVVFVGDLADTETAAGAVRAAVAGRLVLSRLAVSSPLTAFERLLELGVERGPLSATLSCVVAQRVVHRICADCREPYYAGSAELSELGRSADEAGRRLLARGSGCVACAGTGYRGRVAVFEVLRVTDEIRSLLAGDSSAAEIERAAVSAGMQTFRDQCVHLCLEGVTTVSELRRISSPQLEITAPADPGPHQDVDEG